MEFVLELKKTFFVLKNSGVNGWFIRLVMILAIIILILGYLIYRASYQNIYNKLALEANNIERYISVLSDELGRFTEAVGHRISNEDKYDISKIESILHELNDPRETNLIANSILWPYLSWADADGTLLTHWRYGILKQKYNIKHRAYFKEGKKAPWNFTVSPPDNSIMDGNLIVPAGMGITGKDGKLLGVICCDIDVESFIMDLSKQSGNDIKFLVLDKNYKVYFASDKTLVEKYPDLSHFNLEKSNNTGTIVKFLLDDTIYLYQKQIPSNKWIIFIGYNSHTFYATVMSNTFFTISLCILISAICLLIVCYASSTLINAVKTSEKMKLDFKRSIHDRLSDNISVVLNHCRTIHSLSLGFPSQLQEKLYNSINYVVDRMEHIGDMSLRNIELVATSLNGVVKNVVGLKYIHLMDKGIKLNLNLENDLPQIFVNPRDITQIIESVLSKALIHFNYGSTVTITTYSEVRNEFTKNVFILFEGNNVISKSDNQNIKNVIYKNDAACELIVKLTKLNHGQLMVDSSYNQDSWKDSLLIKFKTSKLPQEL